MRKLSITLFLFLTVHISAETVLIKGGLVHSANGDTATIQDILISDNTIVGIGNNLIIDGNTRVIEVNGLPVTPGLISPMSNLGIVEINALDAVSYTHLTLPTILLV